MYVNTILMFFHFSRFLLSWNSVVHGALIKGTRVCAYKRRRLASDGDGIRFISTRNVSCRWFENVRALGRDVTGKNKKTITLFFIFCLRVCVYYYYSHILRPSARGTIIYRHVEHVYYSFYAPTPPSTCLWIILRNIGWCSSRHFRKIRATLSSPHSRDDVDGVAAAVADAAGRRRPAKVASAQRFVRSRDCGTGVWSSNIISQ